MVIVVRFAPCWDIVLCWLEKCCPALLHYDVLCSRRVGEAPGKWTSA